MTEKKITYYIPHPTFFSKHPYGRVTHAIGILNGLVQNGFNVTVVAEEGIMAFSNRLHPDIKYKLLKAGSYMTHLIMLMRISGYIEEGAILLYRKTIFSFIWRILFDLIYSKRRNLVVSEVNGFIFDYDERFKMNFLARFSVSIHKLLLRRDNLVYVVNDDLRDKLITGHLELPARKVVSIHNGGPDPNPIGYIAGDKLHLVYFGLIAGYNEWSLFIECVKARQDVLLHIVGGGPDLDELKIQTGADKNIYLYGPMSFGEFKKMIKQLSGKVVGIVPNKIPNRLGSLSPIKAFDYMSLGMPLVYSHICLQNQVEDGVEGFTYEVGNLTSLASAVDRARITSNYLKLKENCITNYSKHTWQSRMSDLIIEIDKCVE